MHHRERREGYLALQLARDLDCQHKTAFVLAHKIREAMAAETADATLSGEVEIDGAYFGGHIRPANRKENRIDRRRAPVQTGKRRVVIALRERKGRTLTFVGKSEPEGVEIAARVVPKGSTIVADEATHWDILPASLQDAPHQSLAAYTMDGISHEQVESFFSRLRRMIDGQHHHVSPRYLHHTPRMPRGWKIIAASTTARSATARPAWRSLIQRAAIGAATGRGLEMTDTIRPARTDTYEHTISGLLAKRADLFNEAIRLRDRLAEIRNDIGAIDRVLGTLGYKGDLDAAMPRQKREVIFGRGELTAAILNELRDAPAPCVAARSRKPSLP